MPFFSPPRQFWGPSTLSVGDRGPRGEAPLRHLEDHVEGDEVLELLQQEGLAEERRRDARRATG